MPPAGFGSRRLKTRWLLLQTITANTCNAPLDISLVMLYVIATSVANTHGIQSAQYAQFAHTYLAQKRCAAREIMRFLRIFVNMSAGQDEESRHK